MAELLIKFGNNTHSDSDKDQRGCYKHGDIVEVYPDGEMADKPWSYVLKVPGLSQEKVKFLDESELEFFDADVAIPADAYETGKDKPKQSGEVNHKPVEVKFGLFVDEPVVVETKTVTVFKTPTAKEEALGGTGRFVDIQYKILRGKVLRTKRRRRFNIPSNLMDQFFGPNGETSVCELSIDDFIPLLDKFIDHAHSSKEIKDTTWRPSLSVK